MGINMHQSFAAFDRKLPATAGTHSQRELQIHSEAPPAQRLQLLPAVALTEATFTGVLGFALIQAGAEQRDVARAVHVSEGYMSRFLSSLGEQWAKRLVRFMRATRCLGPLQWLADQVGCEIVQRDARAAEVAALQARVAELQRAGRAAA
jgi:hypothetical protein